MKAYEYAPGISLIDIALPIPGYERVLGSYVIKSTRTALIDIGPASSLPGLLAALSEIKISPQEIDYILATHIHLDHLGGLGRALQVMPGARTIVHEKGIRHLIDPSRLWKGSLEILGHVALDYGRPEPVPPERLVPARDGMIIDLGDIQIEVLLTPGHAPHHLSFLDRRRGRLFPGEAAGVYFPDTQVSRPASPPPFDLKQTLASVDKLIAAQPGEMYYSHFGYSPDAMTQLRHYKQQVIAWGKIIARHPDDNIQLVIDEVLSLDDSKERIYGFPPERLRTELYFITNSIRGYQDYFKREGTAVLEEAER